MPLLNSQNVADFRKALESISPEQYMDFCGAQENLSKVIQINDLLNYFPDNAYINARAIGYPNESRYPAKTA